VIIYVNGAELTRINMTAAPDAWLLLSTGLHDEDNPRSVSAPISLPANVAATIAVSMHNQANNSSDMGFDFTVESLLPEPPQNDNLADAIELTGTLPQSTTGSNDNGVGGLGGTKETGEPDHAGEAGGGSVWWKWTAADSERVFVSTDGSSFNTLLGVYTGSSVGALTVVSRYPNLNVPASSAAEPFHVASRVEFDAVRGTTYHLAVDGAGGEFGNVSLEIGSSFTFLDPVAELLPAGSDWLYLLAVDAGGQPIDPDDLDSDFDDTWQTAAGYDGPAFSGPAPALLGYGAIEADPVVTNVWNPDGSLATDEPPSGLRHAVYFRTTFTPSAPVENVGFEGLIDDGAIIFLDGVEVARMNVDEGLPATSWARTVALGTFVFGVESEDGPQVAFALDRNLPSGVPVEIAVSVHNSAPDSSDLGFDLRVYSVNKPQKPPVPAGFDAVVTKTGTPGEFRISWRSKAGSTYDLQWTDDPNVFWLDAETGLPADASGINTFLDSPGVQFSPTGFYRVLEFP